jgi:hypothetical protein
MFCFLSVLPDNAVHRYFAQIYWKIIPKHGDILIAVPLSILAESSGKIAEFYLDGIWTEKQIKTDEI